VFEWRKMKDTKLVVTQIYDMELNLTLVTFEPFFSMAPRCAYWDFGVHRSSKIAEVGAKGGITALALGILRSVLLVPFSD
jgi:hypothetical protein